MSTTPAPAGAQRITDILSQIGAELTRVRDVPASTMTVEEQASVIVDLAKSAPPC